MVFLGASVVKCSYQRLEVFCTSAEGKSIRKKSKEVSVFLRIIKSLWLTRDQQEQ